MDKIKQIISQKLNEQYEITEKVDNTLKLENEEEKINGIINILEELHNKGYGDDEIETIFEQRFFDTELGQTAVNSAKGGSKSLFKEWLLRSLLKMFGFKGPLRDAVAASFADLTIPELINVFKTYNGCNQYGNNVIAAMIEGLYVYLSGGVEDKSLAGKWLRNIILDYLRSTKMLNSIKTIMCDTMHNKNNPAVKQITTKLNSPKETGINKNGNLPLQTKK